LRDRTIDDARFAQRAARLDVQATELSLLLTRVGVQQQAIAAYWHWVAKGQELRIYEDLLAIATRRQAGFEEQVRQGALAKIFLTENQQNITRRTRLVTLARRDVAIAANRLSMYYRDAAGQPLQVSNAQLPQRLDADTARLATLEGDAVGTALSARPELALLRNAMARERATLALARNQLQPALDMGLEVRAGLGAEAEGGPSRDSTDTVVGFTFSVPFQRRQARGAIAESMAELEQVEARTRYQQERIGAEIRNLLVELEVAAELVTLAEQEVEQSEAMRLAEQQRFQSGASDFFLVNVREETAADARITRNAARLNLKLARTKVDAATVDLQRLGLR
jgi:outer membrane protein TolC